MRAGDAEADDTTGLDWMELSAEPVREILVNAGFIGEMGGDGAGNMNMETVVDQLRLQILTQVMGNVTETVIDQTGYVELRPGKVEKLKRINRDIYIEKIQEKLGAIKTYELESYGETLMRSFNNDPLNLETQIRLDAVRRELDKRIVVTGAQED